MKYKKHNKGFQSSALSKYVRMSPFKVRRIIDQIRGRSSEEALMILKFMPYKACPIIFKVVNSALANAKAELLYVNKLGSVERKEQLSNVNLDSLYIVEARVDSGTILKRVCPHAQGRGFPINKRMCHITS